MLFFSWTSRCCTLVRDLGSIRRYLKRFWKAFFDLESQRLGSIQGDNSRFASSCIVCMQDSKHRESRRMLPLPQESRKKLRSCTVGPIVIIWKPLDNIFVLAIKTHFSDFPADKSEFSGSSQKEISAIPLRTLAENQYAAYMCRVRFLPRSAGLWIRCTTIFQKHFSLLQ